ncbi:MAG: ABC transporter ATP-binding protein [Coriobacteriia bacterium]|nr:ABC transporter ATP-binding protein [Coriobacteriia bacterium]MCL2745852.1 ABC transporter ATP-binding protein [Coriobacteriia bacterium]MCL2870814.1 ABC transporter ATP-binding protein [Coriobacteriia bacterium]
MTLLQCKELTKTYEKGSAPALNGLDLDLERGKIIGLLGPNGSGKTTLIKIINGLLVPTAGKVLINGRLPGIESKKSIAYLPDKSYLADWMRIAQIVDFFDDFYADFDQQRALSMLELLDIDSRQVFRSLSKGTKEKVQLVLVMSRTAQLYLLDEPIGGVDPAARDFILRTILTNYSEEASIVISTHLIADVESILDEVIFLDKGKVTLQSSVDAIRSDKGKSVDETFREVFAC